MSVGVEVVVFPRIAGEQWSDTVGSTLWGMAAGVAVVLDIVLGPAKIAPVVLPAPASGMVAAIRCTVLQIWRSVGPAGQGPVYSSGSGGGSGARGGPGPPGRSAGVHTRRSGGHVEVPDSSRGEVRGSVRAC